MSSSHCHSPNTKALDRRGQLNLNQFVKNDRPVKMNHNTYEKFGIRVLHFFCKEKGHYDIGMLSFVKIGPQVSDTDVQE